MCFKKQPVHFRYCIFSLLSVIDLSQRTLFFRLVCCGGVTGDAKFSNPHTRVKMGPSSSLFIKTG